MFPDFFLRLNKSLLDFSSKRKKNPAFHDRSYFLPILVGLYFSIKPGHTVMTSQWQAGPEGTKVKLLEETSLSGLPLLNLLY